MNIHTIKLSKEAGQLLEASKNKISIKISEENTVCRILIYNSH